MMSKNTVDVYFNSNVYRKYSKDYSITLWHAIINKSQYEPVANIYEYCAVNGSLVGIDNSFGITIDDDNKTITTLIDGLVYRMSEVIMEIPADLYAVFNDLAPYCSHQITVTTSSFPSSTNLW